MSTESDVVGLGITLILIVAIIGLLSLLGFAIGLASSIMYFTSYTKDGKQGNEYGLAVATLVLTFVCPPIALITGSILLRRMKKVQPAAAQLVGQR